MSAAELAYGVRPDGYRLPECTRLGPVRLQISDLERSLDYYRRVLGFRVVEQSPGRAALAANGDDTVLIELRERKGARAVPRRGLLGLYHYAILLPDRAALGRFLVHLTGLAVYAGMSDHLVSEALYLTDPDGLGIEVYADRPRSQWSHSDRQLTMATNPLDVRDVIAAAKCFETLAGRPHQSDRSEVERQGFVGLGTWQRTMGGVVAPGREGRASIRREKCV